MGCRQAGPPAVCSGGWSEALAKDVAHPQRLFLHKGGVLGGHHEVRHHRGAELRQGHVPGRPRRPGARPRPCVGAPDAAPWYAPRERGGGGGQNSDNNNSRSNRRDLRAHANICKPHTQTHRHTTITNTQHRRRTGDMQLCVTEKAAMKKKVNRGTCGEQLALGLWGYRGPPAASAWESLQGGGGNHERRGSSSQPSTPNPSPGPQQRGGAGARGCTARRGR